MYYIRCLCVGIVTLEDCLLEHWRGFSAKLHFQPRNSTFQRLQPRWSSSFQHSEKREREKLFLLIFLCFVEPFPFPASPSCQDVGSRVHAEEPSRELPSQRCRSISLSVRIIIAMKLILLLIRSDSRLCCTSSWFSRNVETFR